MTNLELERTFLAAQLPDEINGVQPVPVTDIYLPETASVPLIRLRHQGERYVFIKKVPIDNTDLSRHTEDDIELTAEEFTVIDNVSQRQVSKLRYFVPINDHEAQVDVFVNEFAGLVLIDFEFNNQAVMSAFSPPQCCLAEVTQEWFVAGGQLAGKTYNDIKADLARFNYKPLYA